MADLAPQYGAPAASHETGPRGLPLFGSALDFGRDQLGFLEDLSRTYGDVVPFRIAGWPCLLIGDMAAIETILVKDHQNFIKNRIIWRHVRALFGQGLLTSEGEFWHRQRRLAAPPFAARQLTDYGPDMVRIARRIASRWTDGEIVDFHPAMMELSLRIAAKTLFDTEIASDIETMEFATDDLVAEMAARFKRPFLIPDWVPLPGHLRYRRAIREVEAVVARIILERRRDADLENRRDFLSRMMLARADDGNPMSETQLRDEALTMLLAGHETTALALSWTIELLGRNPDCWQLLVNEVDDVLDERDVTTEDVERLEYAEAVVKEAMRLYPPAWAIGRESKQPFTIRGKHWPAGTTIFISQWVLHRDGRYFENPLAFEPARWIGGALEKRLPRFAYMPFGGGPRICIGNRFAMIEAVMALATLAQILTTTPVEGREPTPFPSITLRPQGGVWARVATRPKRH
ncbi:MAG: cytochrome P450 [Rhizobiaceae bacterium]|nr:cytochrome P450 [Rhizobiaceae bacterium]